MVMKRVYDFADYTPTSSCCIIFAMNTVNAMNTNITNITSNNKVSPNYARWLYVLIIMHVVFWTVIPTLVRHTLPMDALEGFVWGQSWLLGYDRNPWLNAWLTHIAVNFGGHSGWLVYFLSQLSVAACFWSVWQLGKKILSPIYALVAVFLLEAIQYYSIAAVDFNDNVLELGLWALTILFFYNALVGQKRRDWLLMGLFAALSLMAKYYAVVLFLPMLCVVLFTKEGRESFTKSGIYLAGIVFAIVVLPHFIWLFNNGFVTLNYALMRVADSNGWQSSGWYFAIVHILAFFMPLFLFSLLWFGKCSNDDNILNTKVIISRFNKIFLVVLGFGPFVITVILAVLLKISLHVMWGTPLLSLWGLMLVTFLQPCITKVKFYRFVSAVLVVFFSVVTIYAYNIIYTGYVSSATYPGKAIAAYIENVWHDYCKQEPYYVVGDRYTSGNVAYFARNKLKACIWDDKIYSCDSDELLRKRGAIFVWRSDGGEAVNANAVLSRIKRKFPQIVVLPDKSFSWIYHDDKPKLLVGAAFLLPSCDKR